jgi:hypothetical protein
LHIFIRGPKRFLARLFEEEAFPLWALGLNLEIPYKSDE